jgi:hypothetical protein
MRHHHDETFFPSKYTSPSQVMAMTNALMVQDLLKLTILAYKQQVKRHDYKDD